jgi:crossover junction endodeoxyribonuclease RuvC
MRVLAIDPGYGRCGVAIVEKENYKEVVLHSDCIETSAQKEFPARLGQIVGECSRLLTKYKPDAMALEKLYVTKNQKTAMRVAEVRGALIAAAQEAGVPVFEYTPGEVKSAAAGFGGADKTGVIKMLRTLVKIRSDVRHDDEYDAIALGITHLSRVRE